MFVRRKAGGLKRFLNVIFEEAKIYGNELDNLVEENIKYVLQRVGRKRVNLIFLFFRNIPWLFCFLLS